MDLWIRSQDKEKIVKINYLDIVTNVPNNVSKIVYEKSGCFNIDAVECLGTYSSRERCIEILDEIQRLLKYQQYEKFSILTSYSQGKNWKDNDIKIPCYFDEVYEMPSK